MLQTEKLLSNPEEFNLTKEQAEFIIKNFWYSLREYFIQPDECRLGISLPYLSFPIHENQIYYTISRIENITSKTPKGEQNRIKKLKTLKNVLKNLDEKRS